MSGFRNVGYAMTGEQWALTEFDNPEVIKQEKLLASGRVKWAQPLPGVVKLYQRDGADYLVPRGCVDEPVSTDGLAPVIEGLYPYQQRAVEAVAPWASGMVHMPCGAGKTQVGIALAAMVPGRVLVLVHTRDLAKQWRERFAQVLGVDVPIVAGAAKVPQLLLAERFVIASIPTVVRHLSALTSSFALAIIDEAHHAPASQWMAVLERLDTERLVGLTATPERADGWTPAMRAWLGPIRASVGHDELQATGRTVAPAILRVDTGVYIDGEYNDIVEKLSHDRVRNAKIVAMACRRLGTGPQLLLSLRVEHAQTLGAMLAEKCFEVRVLTGETSPADREEALRLAREGKLDALVATQLADEGLDVPALQTLHLTLPARNPSGTEQRIGRIMRGSETPWVIDYVDKSSLCVSQWAARARVYRAVGATMFRREGW